MKRAFVVCVRLPEPPAEARRHLEWVRRVERDALAAAGEMVGFGADRVTLAFPEEQSDAAWQLARALAHELRDAALGVALGPVQVDAGRGRGFGAGLALAESLANAARPGEILADAEPHATARGVNSRGPVQVQSGVSSIAAFSCSASALVPSVLDEPVPPPSGPLPPLTPPPPRPSAQVESGPTQTPARVSIRPPSAAAPPFRSQRPARPAGSELIRATPPPKPSTVPREGLRRSIPPPKPAERVSALPPSPQSSTELGADDEERSAPPSSAPPSSAPPSSAPPSSAPPSELSARHDVVAALRSGDAAAMLAMAEHLRREGSHVGLVSRLEALARLAQGDVGHGLGSLRDAATAARLRDSKNQSRAALALAVGMALAGRRQEALLHGLSALSRARGRHDERGEQACTAFLGQLARAAGHPDVAEAWLARSKPLVRTS